MFRMPKACMFVALIPLAIGAAACPDPERRPDSMDMARGKAASGEAADDPSRVVATIDGQPVTLAELDEELEETLSQVRKEYESHLFELRRQGLDRLIAHRLLEKEAKREGVDDTDTYVQQIIERGTPFPTDEEVRQFYDSNRELVGDQPFESLQPQITQYLHQTKKAERFGAMIDELREQANVRVHFREPRTEVEAVGPSVGPDDAPVTIVEFSNFICPFCIRAKDVMDQVKETYGDQVRVVFRQFPPPDNMAGMLAAEAALCAADQDGFWPMYDLLFANSPDFSLEKVKGFAGGIEGIDMERFEACVTSGETREQVMADIAAGRSIGVDGTPVFFVNGVMLRGAQPFEAFKEMIDEELRQEE